MHSMGDLAARWAPVWAVALLVLVGSLTNPKPVIVVAVAAAVTICTVVVFRAATGWILVGGAVLAAVAIGVLASGAASNLSWFAICVLAGWTAFRSGTVPAVTFGTFAVTGFLTQWLWFSDEPGWGAWIAGTVFTLVTFLMAQRQRELLQQLRTAQAGLIERAATEERARIARELHDVIGHALTVSLLHVTSARLALEEDPAEAAAALEEAERLGQQSLTEVRHAVGLLRSTDPSARTPLPGAGELSDLVDGFRRTGARLEWRIDGDPTCLSATSGLTLYRILQEALTNAARHAAGARIRAQLTVRESAELVVDSDGPATSLGVGAGLDGMRERAKALGGTLSAGPTQNGWQVRAVLPI